MSEPKNMPVSAELHPSRSISLGGDATDNEQCHPWLARCGDFLHRLVWGLQLLLGN
jgi:hypothetical protein